MLKETIEMGLRLKVITPAQIQRINVDTTVQTKAVRFPTAARLYHRARECLVKTVCRLGLHIMQSYERVGPAAAHAAKSIRATGCTCKLRTALCLVSSARSNASKLCRTAQLSELLTTAKRIPSQQPQD